LAALVEPAQGTVGRRWRQQTNAVGSMAKNACLVDLNSREVLARVEVTAETALIDDSKSTS